LYRRSFPLKVEATCLIARPSDVPGSLRSPGSIASMKILAAA